ncbi:unnamed protein product, partial [Auanema sp. JU1783]
MIRSLQKGTAWKSECCCVNHTVQLEFDRFEFFFSCLIVLCQLIHVG